MIQFLVFLAGSLAWAVFQYVAIERSNRTSWTAAPLPPVAITDGPYRSTSIEARLVSAPFLVKATAFVCLFVGQSFAAIMIVPAFFLTSGAPLRATRESAGLTDLALMVYRLGPCLLTRERRAVFGLEFTMHLLRVGAGALGVFAAFAMMKDLTRTFYFVGPATFAGLFILVSVLLAYVNRSYAALVADADGVV